MFPRLAVPSAVLTMLCVVPYARDVLRGETKPQRVSWFVFALLSTVSAVAQLAAGAEVGAWLSAGAAIGFSTVFLLSIRFGVGGITPMDVAALILTASGLAAWWVTGSAVVSLAATIAAEVAAIVLTISKSIQEPDSETLSTWVIDGSAGGLSVFAVTGGPIEFAYPVHHTLVNLAVAGAITFGRKRRVA